MEERIKTETNPEGLKPGDIVIARRTVRYFMGQIPSSDKIRRGEELVIEDVEPFGHRRFERGTITFTNHADRYGPYYIEDFKLKKVKPVQRVFNLNNQKDRNNYGKI